MRGSRISIQYEQCDGDILIGNGYRFAFTSKKKFNRFIADLNRFFSNTIIDLNHHLSDLQVQFRYYWPYFSKDRKSKNYFQTFQQYQAVKVEIATVDLLLDQMVDRSSRADGQIFIFLNALKISRSIRSICLRLGQIADARSDSHQKILLRNRHEAVNDLISRIERFGSDKRPIDNIEIVDRLSGTQSKISDINKSNIA